MDKKPKKTKFSPAIRVKIDTRKEWEKTKLHAQFKSGTSLKIDDFTKLLLKVYNKFSDEYFSTIEKQISV